MRKEMPEARTRLHNIAVCAGVLLGLSCMLQGSAGIQGSGGKHLLAMGVVSATGTGSIRVGGVDYPTASAAVQIDGTSATAADIATGDIVTLQGLSSGPNNDGIGSISAAGNIRGWITAVDVVNSTIYVNGQPVQIEAGTVFGAHLAPTIGALLPGMLLEVSGFADSADNLVASRIELSGNTDGQVSGRVQGLNPAARTFTVGTVTVNYTGAHVDASLAEGATILAQGSLTANGLLLARQIQVSDPLGSAAGGEGRIQGLITDFASPNYFAIDGIWVSVGANTHLNLHVPLGLNVVVCVTGQFDDSGVLQAAQVKSKPKQSL